MHIRPAGRELLTGFGRSRLHENRVPLRRTWHVKRATHHKEITVMVKMMHFVCIGKQAVWFIKQERTIFP